MEIDQEIVFQIDEDGHRFIREDYAPVIYPELFTYPEED